MGGARKDVAPDLGGLGGAESRRDGGGGSRLSPLSLALALVLIMLEVESRAGGLTLGFRFGAEPLPAPFCGDLVLFGRRGAE